MPGVGGGVSGVDENGMNGDAADLSDGYEGGLSGDFANGAAGGCLRGCDCVAGNAWRTAMKG